MTNIESQVSAHASDLDGIVEVPCGGNGGGGRGPRNATVVSLVNSGAYYNLYPAGTECEKMQKWPRGAVIHVVFKAGMPDYLRLRPAPAGHLGHTLRKKSKSGHRAHFAVPTEVIGRGNVSVKGRVVESWTADDDVTVCIRVRSFYEGGQS
jgi:hypothetical protein